MRNAHTVFDYLFGDSVSDQRCARVLSGWSVPDHTGQVGGAVSPSLDSCSGFIIFYIWNHLTFTIRQSQGPFIF